MPLISGKTNVEIERSDSANHNMLAAAENTPELIVHDNFLLGEGSQPQHKHNTTQHRPSMLDMDDFVSNVCPSWAVVVHTLNPSTWEVQEGRFL